MADTGIEKGSSSCIELSVCDGHLSINLNLRCVFVEGERISLTRLEFELLYYLALRAGRVVSTTEITSEVWGWQPDLRVSHAPVKNCIKRLRSKIEPDPARPQYVITVFGHGYIVPGNTDSPSQM